MPRRRRAATTFYVYTIEVDETVRYVGKGSNNRKDFHMREVRRIARRRASGETVRTTDSEAAERRANGAAIQTASVIDENAMGRPGISREN